MPIAFWLKRFLTAFALIFAVLIVVNLAKQKPWNHAWVESVVWSAIAATIFIITRIYRHRKGQHCALCDDLPTTQAEGDKSNRKPQS